MLTDVLYMFLQVENFLKPETLSVTALLLAYIYVLREEVKSWKNEVITNTNHYREEIKKLVDKNEQLQNEKYQITREVIPLLIELIQKLDREEK